MNQFVYFISGVIVGGLVVWFLAKPSASKVAEKEEKKEPLIEKQAREKEENKRKIMEFFNAAQNKRVANNDIEKLLGVSDATATRYLDELEREGRVRQVGKTGKYVYYERV